jgi:hypothetical protein
LKGPGVGEGVAVGPGDGVGVGWGDGDGVGWGDGVDVGPGEGPLADGGDVEVVDGEDEVWPRRGENVGVAAGVARCVGDPEVVTGVGAEPSPDSTTAGGERLSSPLLPCPIAGTPVGPATAIAPMAPTVAAPVPAHVPRPDRNLPKVGTCAIQAPKPIVFQSLPTEMLRKARTIAGSSCVPATRISSCRAAPTLIGRLYGRGAVITSYTSATDTIRAASEMS